MPTDTLPQNAIVLFDQGTVNELSAMTSAGEATEHEIVTANYSPLEKSCYYRDYIRGLADLQISVSKMLMTVLWHVYSNSIWTAPQTPSGTQLYGTFRLWVEGELPDIVEERSDVWDCARIVESVLSFAMRNPVPDDNGKTITPTDLIWGVGVAKLKGRRGNFEDEDLSRDDKIEILRDLPRLSVRQLNAKYSEPRYKKNTIHGFLNLRAEGTADLLLPRLEPTQVEFIRAALGNLYSEEMVHLSDYEAAILKWLEAAGR